MPVENRLEDALCSCATPPPSACRLVDLVIVFKGWNWSALCCNLAKMVVDKQEWCSRLEGTARLQGAMICMFVLVWVNKTALRLKGVLQLLTRTRAKCCICTSPKKKLKAKCCCASCFDSN